MKRSRLQLATLVCAVLVVQANTRYAASVWLKSLAQPPPYQGWEYTTTSALQAIKARAIVDDPGLDAYTERVYDLVHISERLQSLPSDPVRLIWHASNGRPLLVTPAGRAFLVSPGQDSGIAAGWFDGVAFDQMLQSETDLFQRLRNDVYLAEPAWAVPRWVVLRNESSHAILLSVSDGRRFEVRSGQVTGFAITALARVRVVPEHAADASVRILVSKNQKAAPAWAQRPPHPLTSVDVYTVADVQRSGIPKATGTHLTDRLLPIAAANLAGALAFGFLRRKLRNSRADEGQH